MAGKDNKKNPRRGRIKDGGKDKPAEFEGGKDAAANQGFDPEEIAKELGIWWVDGAGDKYVMEMPDGRWTVWSERKVLKRMRMLPGRMIALRPRENEPVSESDQVLLYTMENRCLDMALAGLAGYPAGVHSIDGKQVVVRSSPNMLEPAEGDWETVDSLIEGLLGENQRDYFHGWMKTAVESLYLGGPGNFRPGQAIIFAGPKDSGKSRIQHQVITGLLGRRSADPGAYMFGRSDFNGEMVTAEHLLMEDPVTSTLTKDRVFFGEMIKGIVVNDTHRLHRKKEDALMGMPYWRLTISVNDDPDKMRILPLLTPDMKDKVMLFHIQKNPLPMPTDTLEERAAFRAQIDEELPCYLHWLLNEYEIPDEMKSTRFGVKEWQDPELSLELFDDTPHAELLLLIDAAEFEQPSTGKMKLWQLPEEVNKWDGKSTQGKVWKGSALDLEKLLKGEMDDWDSTVAAESKKVFAHNKASRLLGRLKEDQKTRVSPYRSNSERGWLINQPSDS